MGTVTLVWVPRRDPKQQVEDDLGGPDEMSAPVEETPAGLAASEGRDRRKVVAVALGIGAVVVAVAVVAYAVNQPQPSVTAGAPSTTAKTTASTTTTPTPTTTTTDDQDTDDQPPADENVEDQAPTDEDISRQQPTDDQTIATITHYYDLLPDNPEAAWDLLANDVRDRYDHVHGDGLGWYRKSWDEYSVMGVINLHTFPQAPRDADGTLTVTYKDGRSGVIPAECTVILEDGRCKLARWYLIEG
jgi:eukaryotic-like serine/threonine-protein kinase